jgi:UPF0755 protein
MKKKKSPQKRKRYPFLLLALISVIVGLVVGVALFFYVIFYHPNVNGDGRYVYIRTGASRSDVITALDTSGVIRNIRSVELAMQRLEYKKIYAGRFHLKPGMNNKEIVRILASNMQSPVNLKIPLVLTKERMASEIARQIELDSTTLINAINDPELAEYYGFHPEDFVWMFLPDTYQFYWNVSTKNFFDRIYKEWHTFWDNKDRQKKLQALRMTKMQAVTLASIVNGETTQIDEMPDIAGVYINRLRIGMRLQADPTVQYIKRTFAQKSNRRVLTTDTQIKHSYNTYQIKGLPPGPINIPAPHHIDAVLNYHHHDYLYFCAKDDFSGSHNFSASYTEHLANARKYRAALNKRGIFK